MKLKIVALFAVLFLGNAVIAQKTGEELYKEHTCNACHMLTDMRMVGPGLEGILERRDREWLKKWIRNSGELVASGDEQAVAVFEEYNQVPMPPVNISDEDLETLIDYIGGVEKEAPVVEETAVAEKETTTETTAATETKAEEAVVEKKPKEKSGMVKALEGRPILQFLFGLIIFTLLGGLVAVISVYRTMKK